VRTTTSLALALTTIALATAPARADEVAHSASLAAIPVGGSATATLPKFDPNLGVLRLVRITVAANVSGTLGFENLNAAPQAVGGYASGAGVGMLLPVTLSAAGYVAGPNPGFIPDTVDLAAYDGAVDYAGPSGVTHAFTGATGDGAPTQSGDVYQPSGIATYAGSGTVSVTLGPTYQQGPGIPPSIASSQSIAADATITVRYTYDPLPTSICGASGLGSCPCGSGTGAGCPNSVNPAGATLASSGSASLANDTLLLSGAGMTNSNALYFQGTSFQYAGVLYGDGLLCVSGSFIRLGTKTNSAGASQYPAAGDLPVSVRGGVTAPGTRYYQVMYRDNGAYCTSATYNTTNGRAIGWGL